MKKFISLFSLSLLASCAIFTKKKDRTLNYMQNIDSIATNAAISYNNSTIQPGDELTIVVSAKDLDVVKPFNQNYSSGELIQDAVAGGNVRPNPDAIVGPTYLVDANGEIDFPILGELRTKGKTIEAFKQDLQEALKKYLKDPIVSVRTSNYKVTVLGEVARPGQYTVTDGHTTLLNALGLAGDLTIYGERDNVLVVRNVNGEIMKQRIDLTKADFINSPYYNLKQGDVIYVSPNETKERASQLNPNNGLYISIASILITIIALIVRK